MALAVRDGFPAMAGHDNVAHTEAIGAGGEIVIGQVRESGEPGQPGSGCPLYSDRQRRWRVYLRLGGRKGITREGWPYRLGGHGGRWVGTPAQRRTR
ncbi:MAG: hypothetical protein J2P36_01830 [Ktedonobacteraceae bacterium]|nr:hypothetical protein [Ktedonobacteraceae bacterium]